MLRILYLFLALMAAASFAVQPVQAQGAKEGGTEQTIVSLPKLRLAVQVNENGQYRMLEVESWLSFRTPQEAQQVNARRAAVGEAMKTYFLGYDFEAFTDPVEGVDLAKQVIRECVAHSVPDAPPVEEVLIKRILLR